jgi:hypothetical protein
MSAWMLAGSNPVRFLRATDVQAVTAALAAGPEKLPEFTDATDWDNWIRERDTVIRGRIDHGIEDSLSELILFGTSFPAPPKLAAAADAVNAAGDLTANAHPGR